MRNIADPSTTDAGGGGGGGTKMFPIVVTNPSSVAVALTAVRRRALAARWGVANGAGGTRARTTIVVNKAPSSRIRATPIVASSSRSRPAEFNL
jgi:hypothetical protein